MSRDHQCTVSGQPACYSNHPMKARPMPVTNCPHCKSPYDWSWEDAFLKFGFGDGDDAVMTETVADVLRNAGYGVEVLPWGFHNDVIHSVLLDGVEQIPMRRIRFGYDDPRDYLPKKLIRLLDRALPENGEVAA